MASVVRKCKLCISQTRVSGVVIVNRVTTEVLVMRKMMHYLVKETRFSETIQHQMTPMSSFGAVTIQKLVFLKVS
ncbi:hypothetical protein PPTG_00347 [Phytophthora nicotianae INRA-310]|uniref:Uncharacterized protein n=1 Tax=Phytophthora nicotianae (strain INRA-310) TaxID=761204 RepID=W2RF38_PHYN3|nr:hypothetical protein PPTG_00347 [Phytophthora nicotianae INRA-310]ETN23841.1 hypothetical protein PPTG_00347 [Phytophthora nicotianae INRA-310]